MSASPPSPAPAASGKRFVLVGAAALTLLLSSAFLAFSGIGRQRFELGSKMSEAHVHVAVLARGVAACLEHDGPSSVRLTELPPSTRLVPADLAALGTDGYRSTFDDWNDLAFKCAGFAIGVPQRFQYRWERVTQRAGLAEAAADLDQDGRAETFFYSFVACVPGDARDARAAGDAGFTLTTMAGADAGLACVIGPVETASFDAGRAYLRTNFGP